MKKIFTLVIGLILSANLFAQNEQTIFGNENHNFGGYGGPVRNFTALDGGYAISDGAHGGLIVDHSIIVGFGWYGYSYISKESNWIDPNTNNRGKLDMNYAGLELEYVIHPEEAIHYSVSSLFGTGWVDYHSLNEHYLNNYKPDYGTDWIMLAIPSINLEVNVTNWFRVDFGIGYRFVLDANYVINNEVIDNKRLSAPFGAIGLKFGKF